jgi:hypothetical protein
MRRNRSPTVHAAGPDPRAFGHRYHPADAALDLLIVASNQPVNSHVTTITTGSGSFCANTCDRYQLGHLTVARASLLPALMPLFCC